MAAKDPRSALTKGVKFGKGGSSKAAGRTSAVAQRQFGRRPAVKGAVGGKTAGLRGNAGGGKSG